MSSAEWVKAWSNSKQAFYYACARTRESYFHDDALPPGWAFGRDAAGVKFYIHLDSRTRQQTPPSAGSAAPVVGAGAAAAAAAPQQAPPAAPHAPAAGPPSATNTTTTATAPAAAQLSFQASQQAGDDLASTPYIPDEASGGANIPREAASKRDYLFALVHPDLRWRLQFDDVALYSITESRTAARQSEIALELVGPAGIVTDATACVGGNTLSFAQHVGFVNACELSKQRAGMLYHNVGVLGLSARVKVVHGDYTRVAFSPALVQDLVFFDPPWGGPEYKSQPRLDLFLGTTDVADIIVGLTRGRPAAGGAAAAGAGSAPPFARYVLLKAPENYNTEGLVAKLTAGGTGAKLLRVEQMKKQLLLVIEAAALAPVAGAGGGGAVPAAAPVAGVKRPREEAPPVKAPAAVASEKAEASSSAAEGGAAPTAKRAKHDEEGYCGEGGGRGGTTPPPPEER